MSFFPTVVINNKNIATGMCVYGLSFIGTKSGIGDPSSNSVLSCYVHFRTNVISSHFNCWLNSRLCCSLTFIVKQSYEKDNSEFETVDKAMGRHGNSHVGLSNLVRHGTSLNFFF